VGEQYCLDCHNRQDLAGGRAFDGMSPDAIAENAETWEAAIRKLRGGLMPPAGARRPEGDALAELETWLIHEIDTAAREPAPGRVSLRRLNRREYAHAVRDLLIEPARLEEAFMEYYADDEPEAGGPS